MIIEKCDPFAFSVIKLRQSINDLPLLSQGTTKQISIQLLVSDLME